MGRVRGVQNIIEKMNANRSAGRANFLKLENDGEEVDVRFLYESSDDIESSMVHMETVDGKFRRIECLESGDCPMCRAFKKPSPKIYFIVQDMSDGEVKIWERPASQLVELQVLFKKHTPIYQTTYTIVRHGKKGDTSTKYQCIANDTDKSVTLESLPKPAEVYGHDGIVWERSHSELVDLVEGKSKSTSSGRDLARGSRNRMSDDSDLF